MRISLPKIGCEKRGGGGDDVGVFNQEIVQVQPVLQSAVVDVLARHQIQGVIGIEDYPDVALLAPFDQLEHIGVVGAKNDQDVRSFVRLEIVREDLDGVAPPAQVLGWNCSAPFVASAFGLGEEEDVHAVSAVFFSKSSRPHLAR